MKITNFIPESQIEFLENQLNKLNRRAVKLGVEPFSLIQTGEFKDEKVIFSYDGKRSKQTVRFIEVTLEGKEVVLDGWMFIAGIDHDLKYNIVNKLVDVKLNKDYSQSAPVCEHCGYIRSRKKTYVVQNIETKKFLQVGSTCIKDFTGHGDAEKILNLYSWLQTCFDTIVEADPDYKGSCRDFRYETFKYISLAAQSIVDSGFISKARADERYETSTSQFISEIYWVTGKKALTVGDDAKKIADYTLTKYVKILQDKPFLNEFETNILNFLTDTSFKIRYGGYVCAAVASAKREMDKLNEPKTKGVQKSNNFVGTPGEKLEENLAVISADGFESQWGGGTRYNLQDTDGNSYVWFSSSSLRLEAGQSYNLKFKLKKHNTWRNFKQNMISHVKIV